MNRTTGNSSLNVAVKAWLALPAILSGLVLNIVLDEIFGLIDLADQRLYLAKERGRDQVEPDLVNRS